MKKLLLIVLVVACTLLNGYPVMANIRVDYTYEKPGDSAKMYEDDRLTIATGMDHSFFSVSVVNKTNAPVIIDWEKVSIIDTFGIARRVCLHDTPYINRTNPIPPSHIPPNKLAVVNKGLVPLDYIIDSFRNIAPLVNFPVQPFGLFNTPGKPITDTKSKIYKQFMNEYDGKKVGLYLPVTFETGTEDYTIIYTFDFSKIKMANTIKDSPKPVKSSGLSFDGFNIKTIEPGSLAEQVGLKQGDVILEINGRAADEKGLKDIDTRLIAGRSVMITYERAGSKDMVTLR